MKITDKTLNYMIFCIYSITLVLGNENLFGINVGPTFNYIIVLLPVILLLLIIKENLKEIPKLTNNKINIIFGISFIMWSCLTFILGIRIGVSGIKGVIHFGVIVLLGFTISRIKFENYQLEKLKKHILISFMAVMIYGIIEYIFNFNLDIYSNRKYPGIKGRVYSTLFIATLLDKYICIGFYFVCYLLLQKKNKNNWFLFLLFILSGITVTLTFSRTGLLIYLFGTGIFTICNIIRKNFKAVFISVLTLCIMILIPGSKYSFQSGLNQFYNLVKLPSSLQFHLSDNKEQKDIDADDSSPSGTTDVKTDASLSDRTYFKKVGLKLMEKYPVVGIGIGNYSYLYNNQNVQLYLDDATFINKQYMYPHSSFVQLGAEVGIIGVILFYLYLYTFTLNISYKNAKKKFAFSNIIFILILAISYVEGIVYSKQFIYLLIIVYSIFTNYYSNLKRNKLNKKVETVDILSLHLGQGGIETSIVNISNALSKKYKVNLIVLYKVENDISNKLNKNVNLKYLYNGKPNKNEFKKALKDKNVVSILKEGIKSTRILYLKNKLIINEIINSNSDAIISTRMEFNILLSKYGKENVLKIAQEHCYHNNDSKYIDNIKFKYENIDYLLALTKTLEKDYKKFLDGNNDYTTIKTIPNMIDTNHSYRSDLKNKKIISVGRLDKNKRINEAINIFSKLKSNWTFEIIGDGVERKALEAQIKSDENINKRVKLLGYKKPSDVMKLLSNSDIFIMTSVTEGLPMVLLEAMSVGVPCIAYDTGNGINDIIVNGKNGYVIKNRNESQFVKKLDNMIKDKKILKDMSFNAVTTADKYSFSNVTKKWIDLLENN